MPGEKKKGEAIFNYDSQTDTGTHEFSSKVKPG